MAGEAIFIDDEAWATAAGIAGLTIIARHLKYADVGGSLVALEDPRTGKIRWGRKIEFDDEGRRSAAGNCMIAAADLLGRLVPESDFSLDALIENLCEDPPWSAAIISDAGWAYAAVERGDFDALFPAIREVSALLAGPLKPLHAETTKRLVQACIGEYSGPLFDAEPEVPAGRRHRQVAGAAHLGRSNEGSVLNAGWRATARDRRGHRASAVVRSAV